jgi:hypothetical protein
MYDEAKDQLILAISESSPTVYVPVWGAPSAFGYGQFMVPFKTPSMNNPAK